MTKYFKEFILENQDLINKNTKESWEKIYNFLGDNSNFDAGEFTEILIKAGIDPAETLGYIPDYYLYHNNISEYEIPEGITFIGQKAFCKCENLINITIPNNVTTIDFGAFNGCYNLKNINIPKSITTISEAVFSYCINLIFINYKGTKKEWGAIRKGYQWDYKTPNYTIKCLDGEIKKNNN